MKTQTTTSQMYCSSAAMRYAQVLYELNVPTGSHTERQERYLRRYRSFMMCL